MEEQHKEIISVENSENQSEAETPTIPDVVFDAGEDTPVEEPVPEETPTPFQKKIAAIPEKKWRLYQIIGGILLGTLTVFTLFYRSSPDSGTISYGFLIAICLALFGPNYLEKQGKREIYLGRKWLCITMGAGMVIAVLILGFSTNWEIFKPVE